MIKFICSYGRCDNNPSYGYDSVYVDRIEVINVDEIKSFYVGKRTVWAKLKNGDDVIVGRGDDKGQAYERLAELVDKINGV